MKMTKLSKPKGRQDRQKKRDYAAEYARRIARGLASGKSRAAARGHGEPKSSTRKERSTLIDRETKLERALKGIKRGLSIKKAAAEEHIAPERLSHYVRKQTKVSRKGGWLVITDTRPRRFPVYSSGELKAPVLSVAETTRASEYLREVDRTLSNQANDLSKFRGQGVTDVRGQYLPFETDLNELYRLDTSGELNFPEIYKIVNGEALNE